MMKTHRDYRLEISGLLCKHLNITPAQLQTQHLIDELGIGKTAFFRWQKLEKVSFRQNLIYLDTITNLANKVRDQRGG